ncbi:MAG: PKD domain-containing protein [Elusimicrobiota bacterium]
MSAGRAAVVVAMGLAACLAAGRMAQAQVSCGDTLTNNTTLTTDLECLGNALTIGASYVTLDCAGHAITGAGTGNGIFLGNVIQHTVIKNCEISHFENGIYYHDRNLYSQVLDNSISFTSYGIYGRRGLGPGFQYGTVSGNAITNALVEPMYLEGDLTGTTVENNTVTRLPAVPCGDLDCVNENISARLDVDLAADIPGTVDLTRSGVVLDCAGHAITGAGTGNGIFLGNVIQHTVIKNCEISHFENGIYYHYNNHYSQALDNAISFTDHALYARASLGKTFDYCTVSGNTITNALVEAIVIEGEATGTTIENNTVTRLPAVPCGDLDCVNENISARLDVDLTADLSGTVNLFRAGVVLDCAGHAITGGGSGRGIYLGNGARRTTIRGCDISGYQFGVYCNYYNYDTRLLNNRISGSQYGVYVKAGLGVGFRDSSVIGNEIFDNDHGLFLRDAAGTLVYHNNFYSNAVHHVEADAAMELSYEGEGNWWGRSMEPCFEPGVDSDRPDLVDGNPYCAKSGWLNLPPVAVAGPDQTVVVGQPAGFDGSGSSDPDGTIVSYDWDFGDSATASGASVNHPYAEAGVYTVTLTVTDDLGTSAADSLIVTVRTPEQGLADLEDVVSDLPEVPAGTTSSLGSKLDNALESLESGDTTAAVNKTRAFINQVNAQRGKKLTEEQADQLTQGAQAVIDSVNAP